ncbi:MAG: ribonucleotide-diphosphate reductase subunit beta [Melioribacteraceae bacterium]|nr:ribonucleotide-diphosphate reductase subunit beta [Melioribacteraceae bacterium]
MIEGLPQIRTKTISFVERYPEFKELTDQQLKVLWFADEIKLEKDVQDVLVNMTEAERHGVITVLRLFTLYELWSGSEFWCNAMMKRYPRPEIQAMCAVFGSFELGVHQKFYARLNELLNLNTDDFYLSYVDDPVLKDRMDFVDKLVIGESKSELDQLVSTGAFSFIEGGVLYSSFAYLKHFQSQGKNKILNMVRGINFSAVDENFHCIGGSALFQKHKEELQLNEEEEKYVRDKIYGIAEKVYEHESRIVDMIFEKGSVDGITDVQLKHFVESRVNLCLKNLGYKNLFKVKYNPIADWFYNGLNSYQFIDFFTGQGREYQRDWNKQGFAWRVDE